MSSTEFLISCNDFKLLREIPTVTSRNEDTACWWTSNN